MAKRIRLPKGERVRNPIVEAMRLRHPRAKSWDIREKRSKDKRAEDVRFQRDD